MDLAMSYSELDVPHVSIRRLDDRFSVLEAVAQLAGEPPDGLESVELEPTEGGRVHVDLHPEFPCVEWSPRPDRAPEGERYGWRIWRPPLAAVPPADRTFLRRWNLLRRGDPPPVTARFDPELGWCDPKADDLERICTLLHEVVRRLTDRPPQAA